MGAPVGIWNVVMDLTEPLNVEGKPITFRSFDAATVQPHLTAFRAAASETVSRTGLRIRAEIAAQSPREASDRLWQVIEKVFYPDSGRRQFGSFKVHMSLTPARTATTRLASDHRAS